jgi:hypothetical protein
VLQPETRRLRSGVHHWFKRKKYHEKIVKRRENIIIIIIIIFHIFTLYLYKNVLMLSSHQGQ